MSFILDALKKSESERQKQAGPALFEVKVAPPRSRFPVWAVVVGTLLGVNLIGMAWLAMRGSPESPAAAASPAPAAAPQPAAAAPAAPPGPGAAQGVPAPAAADQPGYPPGAYPPAAAGYGQPAYPQGAYPPAAGYGPPAGYGQAPATAPATVPPFSESDPAYEPRLARQREAPAPGEILNPDDYEPAVPARRAAAPGAAMQGGGNDPEARAAQARADGAVRRGDVPTYEDMAAKGRGDMPELRLDLHVYVPRPQDRFVLINMKRLHEGEALPEGVRVERITPDGAVLSWRGEKFSLEKP